MDPNPSVKTGAVMKEPGHNPYCGSTKCRKAGRKIVCAFLEILDRFSYSSNGVFRRDRDGYKTSEAK